MPIFLIRDISTFKFPTLYALRLLLCSLMFGKVSAVFE